MAQVQAIITAEKAEEITGVEYMKNTRYNPRQDDDGNWFISMTEAGYLDASDIQKVVNYDDLNITASEEETTETEE